MILSQKTLEILTSFCAINPSMKLDWDGSIASISAQGNVLAVAQVPEKYPFPWFVHDVPQMIGVIKLMDPTLATADTHSDHVVFKQPNSSIIYRFSEPGLIRSVANKAGNVKAVSAVAGITWQEMQQLIKAAMMLRNTHVKIELNENQNQLILTSYTLNNPAVSNFTLNIPIKELFDEASPSKPEEQHWLRFEPCSVKIEHFNILKNDYTFKVAQKCIFLESEDGNIKYWIGKEKENG